MPNIRVVQAMVGETVEIQWMNKEGKRFIERCTAPPESTQKARESEFRATTEPDPSKSS